jgi:hypothetical protein
MRYPPNDISPVASSEAHELYLHARAPVISYHHQPRSGEHPNAILYLCRDRGYDLSKLSANNRSKVRRGLKRLVVRQATPAEAARMGYTCYADTRVRHHLTPISRGEFETQWNRDVDREPFREIWAAFANGEIAALGFVHLCGHWVEIASTWSANAHLHAYPNHALFYTMLYELMHRADIESVSYGLSSVQARRRVDSLHHFKVSVNLEPVLVTRQIKVNPMLRPGVNAVTRASVRLLERRFPNSSFLRTAQGALELMSRDESTSRATSGRS